MDKYDTKRRTFLIKTAAAFGGVVLFPLLPVERAWGRIAATPLVPLSPTLAT